MSTSSFFPAFVFFLVALLVLAKGDPGWCLTFLGIAAVFAILAFFAEGD